MCVSHVMLRLSLAFKTAEAQGGAPIQNLIHQGLYLSHMGHSGGRVIAVCMGLAAGNEP